MMLRLLAMSLLVLNASAQSECTKCCQSGQCDHAFQGSRARCCGEKGGTYYCCPFDDNFHRNVQCHDCQNDFRCARWC